MSNWHRGARNKTAADAQMDTWRSRFLLADPLFSRLLGETRRNINKKSNIWRLRGGCPSSQVTPASFRLHSSFVPIPPFLPPQH